MTDPAEVGRRLRRQASRTAGRDELSRRHAALAQVSPRLGVLDEAAWGGYAREDADAAAALLGDLAHATDRELRAAARRLAVRLALRPPPAALPTASGRHWLATQADPDGADLDLDATLARLDTSPRLRREDVRVRDWERRGRAYVVLVDASGSVAGARLATAVLTAGALAVRMRSGDQLAVVAFAEDALVLRPLDSARPPEETLDALLDLRGGGTTDLAHGLRAALGQAARALSPRREVLLLTDGLHTDGDDPLPVAAAAAPTGARVHVLALTDGAEAWAACAALAAAGGGRVVPLTAPTQAGHAVETVLAAR